MSRSATVRGATVIVAIVAFLAVFGPLVSPLDPNAGEVAEALQPSSAAHWLGTDYLGRDVLMRVIAGARVAALAGVEATVVALVVGGSIGMLIGLAAGWTDRIAMRVIDGISAIPALVLAIALIATLGSGLTRSMFAVGLAFAMSMARLARGLTLAERERLYIDGARVVGAGRWRLLSRHLAPNIAGPIAVQATLVFASAITIEAGLSFLGLGVQPPAASWGSMLSNAQRTIRQAPFQAIPPGVAIVVTVLSINVLGDAIARRRRGTAHADPAGYLAPVTVANADDHKPRRPDGSTPDDAILSARGVTIRYGPEVAVDGADIDVARGEVVAIVGESGSGKTSLAMAIAALLTAPATVAAERLTLNTADGRMSLIGATADGQWRWRAEIGVVFQEPAASLNPLQTVGRQLGDVLRANDPAARDRRSINRRIVELLTDVGLRRPDEVARLRPGQISGGMAQRVMIALALAKNPLLLVADEPTTALDVTVQAELIRLLRRLCAERRFGVVFVTHDLGVASEIADRCLVMHHGHVVETGTMHDIVVDPADPYTAQLVSAVPQNVAGRPILTGLAAARGADADAPLVVERTARVSAGGRR